MRVHRCATSAAAARLAAERFVAAAAACIGARGVFRVALAGGSTPRELYERLRTAALDWGSVEFYWSDERFVPAGDSRSNESMARAALLDAIAARRVFPMLTSATAGECAARYAALLPETLDLVLLGIGADGHTASLFPGEAAVCESSRTVLVARSPVAPHERITLSAAYIERARAVWFLVTGADKAAALARVLRGPENHAASPAQAVARHARQVEVFADAQALGALPEAVDGGDVEAG
jgi:6-phosphogluconolactonase